MSQVQQHSVEATFSYVLMYCTKQAKNTNPAPKSISFKRSTKDGIYGRTLNGLLGINGLKSSPNSNEKWL